MRVIVLALAVALVVGSQDNFAPDFASDMTYEYDYEGKIMGGLPEKGLARAGLKIQAKVSIRKANNVYYLKLSDAKIFEYNGIWPKDAFSLASKLSSELADQLMTPIKFEYTNGLVGKVSAPAKVSATVLNICRGILNILHVTVKKTHNIYDLQERGSQGMCKTHYIRVDKKEGAFTLIKTRDLNHCQDRIYKDTGLAYAHRYPESEATKTKLKGMSTFSYEMKLTDQGSQIKNATTEEIIQFSPFNILNGAAQMEAKQKLILVNVLKTPLESIRGDYPTRGSLQYEFDTELLQTPVQLLKTSSPVPQMVNILNHLVNFNMKMVHEDAPLKFIELIQMLRYAKYPEIESLWAQLKEKPDYRTWILNAIPAIGTSTAVRFTKEKFIARELSVAETAQALIASVHLVTADLKSLNLIKELCMHERVREIPFLHEMAMLGYGTAVSKYCVANPSCPVELLRPIHEILISAVQKVNAEEIILAVKVLGNAGHPGSLKPLMKLLPCFSATDIKLPHRVHIEIVLALRNVAKKIPREVQNIAVKLFTDKTTHAELRMAAAVVLFETKLPMGLVTSLATSLLKEENLQFASFVYSYMKAMTKSTTPDHTSVAIACNVAMKILSPKYGRLSYRYSRAFYYDAYQNPWMMGAAASAFYVNEAATLLPKAVLAKARTYLSGAYADVIEVGVRTDGIQEAILKMKDENSQRIDKITQIVKALSGWRASPSRKPLASMYVKLFGQEIAFANIDKVVFDQLIEFGSQIPAYSRDALQSLLSGISTRVVKPMLVNEIRHIFPTAVGLPMELSFYTAGVAAATVECRASVVPSLSREFKVSQLLDSDISIDASIIPSVSLHTYAVMGVNTALIQAAMMTKAKVYTALPAKVQTKMNIMKGHFKFDFLPVEDVDKIASAFVETYAVARNVEDLAAARLTPVLPDEINVNSRGSSSSTKSTWMVSKSSEIVSDSQLVANQISVKSYQRKICKEYQPYGIKACTEIESRNAAFLRNCLLYSMIGRHGVSVQVARAAPEIRNIEIEIQVGPKAAEKILRTVNLNEDEEVLADKTSKQTDCFEQKFTNDHSHQQSHDSRRSKVWSSSSEAIANKDRYMADPKHLFLTVIIRAVRSDQKLQGYQVTAYFDRQSRRVQIILANLDEQEKWGMYATAVLLSNHKMMASLDWGKNSKQYQMVLTAESGSVATKSAIRVKMSWEKIPSSIKRRVRKLYRMVIHRSRDNGVQVKKAKNAPNQITLSVSVASQNRLNFQLVTPKRTFSKCDVKLPSYLLYLQTAEEIQVYHNNWLDKLFYILSKSSAVECTVLKDKIITFNRGSFNTELPHSCAQVLVQDCSQELKFLVLLKKDYTQNQNQINVKIADLDIDMYNNNNAVQLKVNGVPFQISTQIYQHPTGHIHIRQRGEGITLHAPFYGLQEIYFDMSALKVQVVDWMKGQTCGLCGKADGEVRQEFRMPNGRVANSAISYAHSWVESGKSCRDPSGCLMKYESVKLEKQMFIEGQESKCFSVEPVLRCLPGCSPVRTTQANIGFHCVPADTNLNYSEVQSSMFDKSVDVKETAEAHLACRCSMQCP
ncbi:hypothetical protein fugu_006194 [Takifugu bimaculatus]|uniref:Uncharacterized protein n=1 Tax=Takifugu bimaculatus TaxID=433685 RepID=A0A4Z2B6K7_9TELE|nr:hypothetical protein fugu_006194 [Takifugu bimaculatus]